MLIKMENNISTVFILLCTVFIVQVQSQACPDGLNVANMCIPGTFTSDRIFIDTTTYNTFVSNCTCSFTTTSNVLKLVTYVAPNYPQCNSAIRLQSESGNNMRFECLISGTYLDTTIFKSGEASFENYSNFYDKNYCLMLEVAGQPTDSITVTCSANIPPEFYDTTTEQEPDFMIDPVMNDVITTTTNPAINEVTLSNIDTITTQPSTSSSNPSSDVISTSADTAFNDTAISGLDVFTNDTLTLNEVPSLTNTTKEESQTQATVENTTNVPEFNINHDNQTVENLNLKSEASLLTTVTPIVKTTSLNTHINIKESLENFTTYPTQVTNKGVTVASSTVHSNDLTFVTSESVSSNQTDLLVTNDTLSAPSENYTESQTLVPTSTVSVSDNVTMIVKSVDELPSVNEAIIDKVLPENVTSDSLPARIENSLVEMSTMHDTLVDDQTVQSMNNSVIEQTTVQNMIVGELPVEMNSSIKTENPAEASTLRLQEISLNTTNLPKDVNVTFVDNIVDDNNTLIFNNMLITPDTPIEDLNITTNATVALVDEYRNLTDARGTTSSSTDKANIVTTVLTGTILFHSGGDNSSKTIQNINNITNDLMNDVLNRIETQPKPSTSKYDIIFHSNTEVPSASDVVMEVSSPVSPFKENINAAAITPPMDLSNSLIHRQINPSQNFSTNETGVFDFQGNANINFPSTSSFDEANFENVTFTNNIRLESSPFTANEPRIIAENAEPILPIENITITGNDILQTSTTNNTADATYIQFTANNAATVESNIDNSVVTQTEASLRSNEPVNTTPESVLVTKSNTQNVDVTMTSYEQSSANKAVTATNANTDAPQVTTISAAPTNIDKTEPILSPTVSPFDLNNNFQDAGFITPSKSQTPDPSIGDFLQANETTTISNAATATDKQEPEITQTMSPFDLNNNFKNTAFIVSTVPQSQDILNSVELSMTTDQQTSTKSNVGINDVVSDNIVHNSANDAVSTTDAVKIDQTESANVITSTIATMVVSTINNAIKTNVDQISSASTTESSQVEQMNSNIPSVENISFVQPSKRINQSEYEKMLSSRLESSTVDSTTQAELTKNDVPSVEHTSFVQPPKQINQAAYEMMLNSLPESSTVVSTTQVELANSDIPSVGHTSFVQPSKSINQSEYEQMFNSPQESSIVDNTSQAEQMNSDVPSVEHTSFVQPSKSINQSEYEQKLNLLQESAPTTVVGDIGTMKDQSMSLVTESSSTTSVVNGLTNSDLPQTTIKPLDSATGIKDAVSNEQSIFNGLDYTSPQMNSDIAATSPKPTILDQNPTVFEETIAQNSEMNTVNPGSEFEGFVANSVVNVPQESTSNSMTILTSPLPNNIVTEGPFADGSSFSRAFNFDTNSKKNDPAYAMSSNIEVTDPTSIGGAPTTQSSNIDSFSSQSTTTKLDVQVSTEANMVTEANIIAEEIVPVQNNPSELGVLTNNVPGSTEASIVAEEIIPVHNNPSETVVINDIEHIENNAVFDATNILSEIHSINLQEASKTLTTDAPLVTNNAIVTDSMKSDVMSTVVNSAIDTQVGTNEASSNQLSDLTRLEEQSTPSLTGHNDKSTPLVGLTDNPNLSGSNTEVTPSIDAVDKTSRAEAVNTTTSEQQSSDKQTTKLPAVVPANEVASPGQEFNVVEETKVVTDGPSYASDGKSKASDKEMNVSFDRESAELPLDVDNNTYIIVVGTIAGLVVIAVVIGVICRNKSKRRSEKVNISGSGLDPASHQNQAFDNQVEDPEQGTSGQENKPVNGQNGENAPPPPPETIQY